MNKHSPEPWEWIDGLLVSVPDDRLAILCLSNYPTDYEDEVDRQNMERITLCVNALSGIPTETLKSIQPGEFRRIIEAWERMTGTRVSDLTERLTGVWQEAKRQGLTPEDVNRRLGGK